MSKPNWAAVGATLEVFKAGDLGKAGARAVGVRKASPDATSVHVGLGAATTFDLRVTFPGKEPKIVEYKGLAAGKRWTVTPDGKSESK